MKIPKYVDKLIDRRAKLVALLAHTDRKLSGWLDKNNVDTQEEALDMYINPWGTADAVKRAIHRSGGNDDGR
ncbi:MAG: hypothetical protein HFH62_04670 [Lachnospiraceae bacterium]|nr:hypothetical protein [Lachnospiraceae bacterium]